MSEGDGPLFDPERHEALDARDWNEVAARGGVRRVVEDTREARVRYGAWPAHALDLDGEGPPSFAMLYFGVAGVVWALDHLACVGAAPRGPSYLEDLPALIDANRKYIAPRGNGSTSLLMGDLGIWLTQYRLRRDASVLHDIERAIESSVGHPAAELTWGGPGSMLAALWLLRETGDDRWAEHYRAHADALLASLAPHEVGFLWNQRVQGLSLHCLGLGHGFSGNVFALLAGRHLLDGTRFRKLVAQVETTLSRSARVEDGLANWPKYLPPYCELTLQYRAALKPEAMLVHICHGAPGIVLSLCALPPGESTTIDALLLAAGELVWKAGPLTKGAGLCHGTAGNGYAFLALHRRTGDDLWLARARAFAMHALAQLDAQREETGARRFSLWTGDLGTACFLRDCARGASAFPTLETFFAEA